MAKSQALALGLAITKILTRAVENSRLVKTHFLRTKKHESYLKSGFHASLRVIQFSQERLDKYVTIIYDD